MDQIISHFLLVYFLLFFGIAVVWRSYKVSKSVGASALKLNQKSGAEGITALYFKCLPLLSVIVLIIYVFFSELYLLIGPMELMANAHWQWIGMGLMSCFLIWVVLAQSQMGSSWRVGIDHEKKTEFIHKGLFQYSRNPIFVGVIFISLGYFFLLPNAITLTLLALDIALIQIQVAMEEEYLTKQHGQNYTEYCQHVRRWL